MVETSSAQDQPYTVDQILGTALVALLLKNGLTWNAVAVPSSVRLAGILLGHLLNLSQDPAWQDVAFVKDSAVLVFNASRAHSFGLRSFACVH